MTTSNATPSGDRAELELRALRAVALGLPEANDLIRDLDRLNGGERVDEQTEGVDGERVRLERRALTSVALGLPDADALIHRLRSSGD